MYGSTYTAQKNEAVKKTETKENAPAQAKNTGTDSVSDYYSYLQKNYDCVKNGSVAISGSYLKECARNPEKAKELEENLSFSKKVMKAALRAPRPMQELSGQGWWTIRKAGASTAQGI